MSSFQKPYTEATDMSDAPEENPTMKTAKMMGLGGIIVLMLMGLAVFFRQGATVEEAVEAPEMVVDSLASDSVN